MRASTILTTVLVLAAASCQSERSIRDLSANPALYQPTGYRAGYKQPRKVFIATLVDEREALPPLGDGVYPRTYTQDHFWARPLASMLEDVLRREVGGAELFTEIVDDEALADWVLEPSLAAFYGCVEERVVGRTVHGFAKLHVVVRGPKDAAGLRPVLRSRSFEAPTNAGSLLFSPDPHALAAAALRRAMVLVLVDLEDGARRLDGVPTEARFARPSEQDWARERR